ncbi:MAG: guanylate kinase [Actinomycetota bacterium]|nr:guanylate kinase [Actinomycetota bacterium]
MVDRLLALDSKVWLSRSWTTRPRRPGESESAYTFVERDEFLARVDEGGFLEYTEFPGTGHFYGTPNLEPPPGQDVILEIELNGAQQVKERLPDAKLIVVVPPSQADQEARLRARGDNEQHIRRRLEVGEEEERLGRKIADAVVVNDDIERAAREVAGIIARYR